tara:strand:- start:398 stop:571 length:174 start_codon:yes stop_codon:yes gene_type:complete
MNYFDLLDNDILLKIIEFNIKYLTDEIEKLEVFVKNVDKYWYYEIETDYDLDHIYGM